MAHARGDVNDELGRKIEGHLEECDECMMAVTRFRCLNKLIPDEPPLGVHVNDSSSRDLLAAEPTNTLPTNTVR